MVADAGKPEAPLLAFMFSFRPSGHSSRRLLVDALKSFFDSGIIPFVRVLQAWIVRRGFLPGDREGRTNHSCLPSLFSITKSNSFTLFKAGIHLLSGHFREAVEYFTSPRH